jgi:hypothetical protein
MSQFAECLALEWGLTFIVVLGGAVIALIAIAVAVLSWRQKAVHRGQESLSLSLGKKAIKLAGANLVATGLTLLVVLATPFAIGYAVYLLYDKFRNTYAVVLNASPIEQTLEHLREIYQPDTQVRSILKMLQRILKLRADTKEHAYKIYLFLFAETTALNLIAARRCANERWSWT